LTDDLEAVEKSHIIRVLAEERGNKRAAAARLGLSRRTFYRRLERHQLLDARDSAAERAPQGESPES
jgi:transcriptional regulator of acetoin/glycerol metabolism